jgi:hypothetical protein
LDIYKFYLFVFWLVVICTQNDIYSCANSSEYNQIFG